MPKFENFWEEVIQDNERLLSDIQTTIPKFQSLFKSLSAEERK